MRQFLAVAFIAVFATTCLVAGSAQAQSVSVIEEATGADCDPCSVHLVGESHVTDTTNGVILHTCEDELFAQLYPGGTGEMDWVGTAHAGPGCGVANCVAIPTEAHWGITSIVEPSPGQERLNMRLCFRNVTSGVELHCNVSIPISHPEPHRQSLNMLSLCASGLRRVEATWLTEAAEIEVVHNG